jgi:hypothetical protein
MARKEALRMGCGSVSYSASGTAVPQDMAKS